MRRPIVAGNWKMNGSLCSIATLVDAIEAGTGGLDRVQVVLFPPFVYLPQVSHRLKGTAISLGAQTLSEHTAGAFTGEVSASMLLDFDCSYVLVGHSERRNLSRESDLLVARKFVAARDAGLTPVLCVGESLQEREQGATEAVVARQLRVVLDLAGVQRFEGAVVAYEPVWAIGTGMTATPEQAQEVHAFIRRTLAEHNAGLAASLPILYGGSVRAANAAELLAMPDIDGSLVGGASLDASEFLAIAAAAQRHSEGT